MSTYLDFILLRDTFGNADNEANLVLDSLDNGVCGAGWRDVEHGRVGLSMVNSLCNSSISLSLG